VARRPVRPYHASVVFRAPLPFVFDWCTDYTEDDPKSAGKDSPIHLQRRIVERTTRRVVFENLYDEGLGGGGSATWSPSDRPPGGTATGAGAPSTSISTPD
jgi:hypothetical protein